jgi:hypothetical protein
MHPVIWFVLGALFATFVLPMILNVVRPKTQPQ